MKFDGFDWDAGNASKCQKHGLSIAEIESVFLNEPRVAPDVKHSKAEQRFRAVGRTKTGRHVFAVSTVRRRDNDLLVRPISARHMHRKEIDAYEQKAIP
jgi:uncharacterized protein